MARRSRGSRRLICRRFSLLPTSKYRHRRCPQTCPMKKPRTRRQPSLLTRPLSIRLRVPYRLRPPTHLPPSLLPKCRLQTDREPMSRSSQRPSRQSMPPASQWPHELMRPHRCPLTSLPPCPQISQAARRLRLHSRPKRVPRPRNLTLPHRLPSQHHSPSQPLPIFPQRHSWWPNPSQSHQPQQPHHNRRFRHRQPLLILQGQPFSRPRRCLES